MTKGLASGVNPIFNPRRNTGVYPLIFFRDGFFRNVDLGSETATSSLVRSETTKPSGQQAAKPPGLQPAAKTGPKTAKSGHPTNTIRSEGSLSIDSLSGSSILAGKPIFSETNMQSSLGYLP